MIWLYLCLYGTCKNGYKLVPSNKTCVAQCPKWALPMYAEPRCVDMCPDDWRPADPSVTKGTCPTCAEATATEASPDGERPFLNQMSYACVAACPAGTSQPESEDRYVCRTCEEVYADA